MAEARSEQLEQNKIDYDNLALFNEFGTISEHNHLVDHCVDDHFHESGSQNPDNTETDAESDSIDECGDEELDINEQEIFKMLSEMNIADLLLQQLQQLQIQQQQQQHNTNFNETSDSTKLDDCGTSGTDSCRNDETQKGPNDDGSAFAEPKVFNCRYCVKQFHSKIACRRHELNHMKGFLRCPCCGMNLHSLDNVRRHLNYFHYCPAE